MPVTNLAMPRSHLRYGDDNIVVKWMYPEYTRRKVARFVHLTLEEFDDLPGAQQSDYIAFCEVSAIEERLLAGGLHGG